MVALLFVGACAGDDPLASTADAGAGDARRDGSSQPPSPQDAGDRPDTSVFEDSSAPPADGGARDATQESAPGLVDARPEDARVDASDADTPDQDAEWRDADTPDHDAGPQEATRLVHPDADLTLWDVTADDHAVYFDASERTYYAKPLAGGPPIVLDALVPGGNGFVNTIGKLVAVHTWGATASYKSRLTVWSAELPEPIPVSNDALLAFAPTAWASADARKVVYVRVTNLDATVGAIYGLDADGANPTVLVPSVTLLPTTCVPQASFAPNGYVVVSYCEGPEPLDPDAGTDGGSGGPSSDPPKRAIRAFSSADGWAPGVTIEDTIRRFVVDPPGQYVVTAPAAAQGTLMVYPIAGGSSGEVLDPDVPTSALRSFIGGGSQPWFVVYNTTAGALRRADAPPASGVPTAETLVGSGANYLLTTSPSGSWAVTVDGVLSGYAADLSLVSTATGARDPLATSAEHDNLPLAVQTGADAFTPDEEYALFFTQLVTRPTGLPMGYIRAVKTSDPTSKSLISDGYAVRNFGLVGSRMLLLDNYTEVQGPAGAVPTVDLTVTDPASAAPAVKVATSVPIIVAGGGQPRGVAVTSDRSRVVYSIADGDEPGIYVSDLP